MPERNRPRESAEGETVERRAVDTRSESARVRAISPHPVYVLARAGVARSRVQSVIEVR